MTRLFRWMQRLTVCVQISTGRLHGHHSAHPLRHSIEVRLLHLPKVIRVRSDLEGKQLRGTLTAQHLGQAPSRAGTLMFPRAERRRAVSLSTGNLVYWAGTAGRRAQSNTQAVRTRQCVVNAFATRNHRETCEPIVRVWMVPAAPTRTERKQHQERLHGSQARPVVPTSILHDTHFKIATRLRVMVPPCAPMRPTAPAHQHLLALCAGTSMEPVAHHALLFWQDADNREARRHR